MEDFERVLLVKQEVFVYTIPPRTNIRSYRAADWNLAEPQFSGRMRLASKGEACVLYLEDKLTGDLFAKCPIDEYPGVAIEPVSDSSRYFVICLKDDSGRTAFVGLGFVDRSDSFDFNVALQDHFKWVKKTEDFVKEESDPKPQLDLRFKEGETIKINMKIAKKDGGESASKSRTKGLPSLGLLPPPPAATKSTSQEYVSSTGQPKLSPRSTASNDTTSSQTKNPNWVQF